MAVTAGATILTDIGAFHNPRNCSGLAEGHLEAVVFHKTLCVYSYFLLWQSSFILPRVGKWFFARFTGRTVEFQFVLVVLFVAAVGAKLIGVHEVVGAFLAGLAINAMLPRHSPVSGHVLFMGESFFIPMFLLYSGMITDPLTIVRNPDSIVVALGILLVAYGSKFLAAFITGRIFHYTKAELMTAYGLSHAQAAVTIPTLVIGMQVGLFDSTLFNAAILMILATSITSPLLVQHYAPKLVQAAGEDKQYPLFHRILVPVANPDTQENLVALGNLLAQNSHGKLLVVNVVRDEHGKQVQIQQQKELLEKVPESTK